MRKLILFALLLTACSKPVKLNVTQVTRLPTDNWMGQPRYIVTGHIGMSAESASVMTNHAPEIGDYICVVWESYLKKHGYYLTGCPQ